MKGKLQKMMWLLMAVLLLTESVGMVSLGAEMTVTKEDVGAEEETVEEESAAVEAEAEPAAAAQEAVKETLKIVEEIPEAVEAEVDTTASPDDVGAGTTTDPDAGGTGQGTTGNAWNEQASKHVVTVTYKDKAEYKTVFSKSDGNVTFTSSTFTDIENNSTVRDVSYRIKINKVTREDYTHIGWNYYYADISGKEIPVENPDSAFDFTYPVLICYPIWAGTVEYEVNYPGSNELAPLVGPVIAEENTNISLAKVDDTIEYHFTGWSDGTTVYAGGSYYPVTQAKVTLTGTWEPVEYQVTYDGNGASSGVPAAQTAGYGTSVAAADAPVQKGYKFAGWRIDSTGTIIDPGDTFVMPANNVTLTAVWEIAHSTISGPGTYYLVSGQEYYLGAALKVAGDTSSYPSGITFYVPEDREYTFE